MRKGIGVTILLFTIASVVSAGEGPSIAGLAWLSGCWAAVGGEPGSIEQWTKPAGETLLGIGRTVKGGKTVAHEFMQIRKDASGEIVFIANPSGQKEAAFRLVQSGETSVVFENKDHDFPQRVIYEIESDGTLAARIEGMSKGKNKVIPFPMKSTSCD